MRIILNESFLNEADDNNDIKIKIDLGNNYGKTYVRNKELGIYLEVEISILKQAGLEQGETYPLSRFPAHIQQELKNELAYDKSLKNKALEKAKELEVLKRQTRFSYMTGTQSELFGKNGKLKGLTPDLVLSFTSGRGYQMAFFNGYIQNEKQELFHFKDSESLLKAMFGERYSNGVIRSKRPGRIIGSGGKNIKALSRLVGLRLKVEEI